MKSDAGAWRADLVVSSGTSGSAPWRSCDRGARPRIVAQVPPLPGWMGAASPFAFDATRMLLPRMPPVHPVNHELRFRVGLTTAVDQLLRRTDSIEHHASRLRDLLLDAVEGHGWQPFRHRGTPQPRRTSSH